MIFVQFNSSSFVRAVPSGCTLKSASSGIVLSREITSLIERITLSATETATEDGYNLLEGTTSITPTVVVNGTANATKVTVAEATGVSAGNDSAEAANTMQLTAAQVSKIENNTGSVLPSTGGIGTTIFYVIGAILVLGAGILLVTRRRMNAN